MRVTPLGLEPFSLGRRAVPLGHEGIGEGHGLPVHETLQKTGFIDLHQDVLSGIARLDGGFPAYGSSYLTGASRAAAVWSSLYPHDSESPLLSQLEAHAEMIRFHGRSLRVVTTAADLELDDARVGLLPHSEGLHLPGIDSDTLRSLWTEHSLRSLALTWNHETDYGFSCYEAGAAPLKPAGRQLVRALEQSPLMLDLAHLSDAGFYESLDLYAPPVLVTHSFCRSISDHPRGLDDQQLRALGEHGGLMGLAFDPDFLGQGSIDEALRHIDRIASLAGESAVSIGSDWGVAATGELGDPTALVGLIEAVSTSYGHDLAVRFAFTNAYEFLRAQLPC